MTDVIQQLKDAMASSDQNRDEMLKLIHEMDWKFYNEDDDLRNALAGVMQRRDARREILGGMIVEIAEEVAGTNAITQQKPQPALAPVASENLVGGHYPVNDNAGEPLPSIEPLPAMFRQGAQQA